MTSGLKAIEARSARSRKGQQTRRLARAIAGDRPTGIRCSLDRLGIEDGLRDRCELLFAMGAHLNPLEDAAAVVHVAHLELQAAALHAALELAAGSVEEWRSKQAAYTAVAALRGVVVAAPGADINDVWAIHLTGLITRCWGWGRHQGSGAAGLAREPWSTVSLSSA